MLTRVQKWMADHWCDAVCADEGEVMKGTDKKKARMAKAVSYSV